MAIHVLKNSHDTYVYKRKRAMLLSPQIIPSVIETLILSSLLLQMVFRCSNRNTVVLLAFFLTLYLRHCFMSVNVNLPLCNGCIVFLVPHS